MRKPWWRSATFPRPLRRLLACAGAGAGLAVAAAGPLPAATPDASPQRPLTVEAVRIAPAAPGPSTLCQLRVVVRTVGPGAVSHLAFRVTLDGVELPAYRDRLFMALLAPGERRELRLFNFWTSETARPAPGDGHFELEVALVEARWVAVTREGEVETWTPGEPVAGLPARAKASWGPAS